RMTEKLEGTVTRIHSALCEVDVQGQSYECKMRRRLLESDTGETKPVAVGDRVLITSTGPGEGVVEEALPRRTKLSRRHPRDPRLEHIIVTNVEQLLIVASVRTPPLRLGLIDRYVIAAEAGLLVPIICINKIDLAETTQEYAEPAQLYRDMGYTVLVTSAKTGEGIAELREALRGKSTALAGHSGVGKSALINRVQPGLKLRTAPVTTTGRHTTSSVTLRRLDCGGYVVDTPGIREFTLWEIEREEVQQFFPGIWRLAHDCEMPDCLHLNEPNCAVRQAVETGRLPAQRYESYVRIVETIQTSPAPRGSDVEKPSEQITKRKRAPSRKIRKQRLRRRMQEELDEDSESMNDENRR
ncbi:MAG: ribosome small subunit-dependent GTPase A, partial [Planctomycetes bacterium]|nr:ribosome small subunit-dependent GTPase A [Planctomycetota bacterium]